MISNFAAARGRIILVMLAASTAFSLPIEAKEQPASSGEPNKASQPHSAAHVITIPVPRCRKASSWSVQDRSRQAIQCAG